MPRRTPVKELLKEEAVPTSPLRRSSRLTNNSPVPPRVVTRRNSATEAPVSTTIVTRSRRSSLSQEQESNEDDKKKTTSTIRTRRSSLTQSDDQTQPEPTLKSRTRSSSNSKELEEAKRTTRSRRSISEEPEAEDTVKKITRSRSGSITKKTEVHENKSSDKNEASITSTPIKKSTLPESFTETLDSIEEATHEENSPNESSSKNLRRKTLDATKIDFDLSVINEASMTEEESTPQKKTKVSEEIKASPAKNTSKITEEEVKNSSDVATEKSEDVQKTTDSEDKSNTSTNVEPANSSASEASFDLQLSSSVLEDTQHSNKENVSPKIPECEPMDVDDSSYGFASSQAKEEEDVSIEMKRSLKVSPIKRNGIEEKVQKMDDEMAECLTEESQLNKSKGEKQMIQDKVCTVSLVKMDLSGSMNESITENSKSLENVEKDVTSEELPVEKYAEPVKEAEEVICKETNDLKESSTSKDHNLLDTIISDSELDDQDHTVPNIEENEKNATQGSITNVEEVDKTVLCGETDTTTQDKNESSAAVEDTGDISKLDESCILISEETATVNENDLDLKVKTTNQSEKATEEKEKKELNENAATEECKDDYKSPVKQPRKDRIFESISDDEIFTTKEKSNELSRRSMDPKYFSAEQQKVDRSGSESSLEVVEISDAEENKDEEHATDKSVLQNDQSMVSQVDDEDPQNEDDNSLILTRKNSEGNSSVTRVTKKRSLDKTSITLQGMIVKAGEDVEKNLSGRIHKVVDLFCAGIGNTSDVSINVSLECVGQASEDENDEDVTEEIQKGSKRRKICINNEEVAHESSPKISVSMNEKVNSAKKTRRSIKKDEVSESPKVKSSNDSLLIEEEGKSSPKKKKNRKSITGTPQSSRGIENVLSPKTYPRTPVNTPEKSSKSSPEKEKMSSSKKRRKSSFIDEVFESPELNTTDVKSSKVSFMVDSAKKKKNQPSVVKDSWDFSSEKSQESEKSSPAKKVPLTPYKVKKPMEETIVDSTAESSDEEMNDESVLSQVYADFFGKSFDENDENDRTWRADDDFSGWEVDTESSVNEEDVEEEDSESDEVFHEEEEKESSKEEEEESPKEESSAKHKKRKLFHLSRYDMSQELASSEAEEARPVKRTRTVQKKSESQELASSEAEEGRPVKRTTGQKKAESQELASSEAEEAPPVKRRRARTVQKKADITVTDFATEKLQKKKKSTAKFETENIENIKPGTSEVEKQRQAELSDSELTSDSHKGKKKKKKNKARSTKEIVFNQINPTTSGVYALKKKLKPSTQNPICCGWDETNM